jgi:ABC-2 type transport system permease protein
MSLSGEFHHVTRIARTELLRGWRSTVDRWTLVAVGLGLCLFAAWTLFIGVIGYVMGSFLPTGQTLTITESMAGQAVGWTLFLAGMIAFQVVERRARIDNEDLLFTTVSPRTVLLGLLSAEFARELFLFGPAVLVGATGFAIGAGAPTLVPVAALVALPLLVFVVLLGHTAGIATKLAVERMSGFDRLRTVLGVLAGVLVGIFPMLFFGGAEWLGLSIDLGSLLVVVPIAAYVDLLAVGTPLVASVGLDTVVAVALVLGALPVLIALDYRLSVALWFGASDSTGTVRTSAHTPPAWLPRGSTGWLVWWYWLRGLRAPSRFTHLIYYSFPLFWLVFDAIRDPATLPSALSTALVVLGVAFAGATFGLNPLGDERKALPAVLTTPAGGRFVRARVLAGLPWITVSLAGVALGAVIGRFDPLNASFLAIVVGSLGALSATVAPVFGIALPRFEPIAATKNETITPSLGAVIGHVAVVGIAGVGGLLAVFGPPILGALSGSTPTNAVRLGLICVVAAAVVGTSVWSYRHATSRFRTARVG